MSEPYKFGGREHPFSNFYPAAATYEGITYLNGEAAFQSAKTLDMNIRRTFAKIEPSNAKGRGRRIKLRADWETVKLKSKFQDPKLKKLLLETGDCRIVENTTGWHDNEWGDCQCEKCKHITGKNLLGKALMEIRAYYGVQLGVCKI